MKKRLLILLTILAVFLGSCGSAPATLPPEELVIQRIFEVDKSKDELYRISMEWMAKTFKSSKAVIQYEDKEEGVIVGKGFTVVRYGLGIPANTYFTLTIEVKDNKARATVEDAYFVIDNQPSNIDNEFTMGRFKPKVMEMFASLQSAFEEKEAEW
jgi:hypothetical protein